MVSGNQVEAKHMSERFMQTFLNGGNSVDTFATLIRNTDPGSTAGVPGISIPAGVTSSGLPVGLSLDGAMHSDQRLLAIGMAMEGLLGLVPAPSI
jgi:Asp-tRNA(Asn)/Glu-tRNA(Gln) amidotransferase A subunit family amidase